MLRQLRRLVRSYLHRRGPLMAQGIAYSLLIGSTPLLLLSVSFAGLLYRLAPGIQMRTHVRIRVFLPQQIAESLISQIDTLAGEWARMGLVGAIVLLFVSKGIFDAFGAGLAAVVGGTHQRPAMIRHLFSLLLTLLAIAMVIVISLDDVVIGVLVGGTALSHTSFLYHQLAVSFSTLLLAVVLFLIYVMFASRRIHIGRVVLASLAVSVLWHALGQLGRFFVGLFARYRLVYGVFGGAVLYLVWLQVFAHLVLLGGLFVVRSAPGAPDDEAEGMPGQRQATGHGILTPAPSEAPKGARQRRLR